MKRFILLLVLLLAVQTLAGCRFSVVEDGEITVASTLAASAEGKAIGKNSRDRKNDTRVSDMQRQLVALGYLDRADGIFGANTEKALKAFQQDRGLDITGVLDEVTRLELYMDLSPVDDAMRRTVQALREAGGDLHTLQVRLRRYGFMTAEADGQYTEQTRSAVLGFQRYAVNCYGGDFDLPHRQETALAVTLGIGATPVPTPAPRRNASATEMPMLTPMPTLEPAYEIDGVPTANLYNYLVSDLFPVFRTEVQQGDSGAEVLRVQRRLFTLGYLQMEPDGIYDNLTREAVRFFQRRNGVLPSGVADERTQIKLFGESPELLETVEKPYYIKVSIDDQRVYAYRWVDGEYSFLVREMICSTGVGNSTPRGVFVSTGHRDVRWHYFTDFNCWAQYAFVIKGGILFHSILYNRPDESAVRQTSVQLLGHKASHGCVRLMPEDAKWIYENCGKGQVVEIY